MNLAAIVTYNPNLDLLMKNINAVYPQVDKILIIENNSNNQKDIINIIKKSKLEVEIILNSNNFGIAEALNQALEYAKFNHYSWLLTLDQDSVCPFDMISNYEEFLNNCNNRNDILLLCPDIQDINMKDSKISKPEAEEIIVAITSGSYLNVENSLHIGGFLKELFIDYVDFEFCLRGKKESLRIIKLNNIVLSHQLGSIIEKRIFGYNLIITNHSPIRRYYLFRNKIYIYKRYWRIYRQWVIRNIFSSIKVILVILFYEDRKGENLKNIIKGLKDGFNLKAEIKK
ncbi:glycosyltransferase [Niallia hominis]|uniref:Glycosyltransferase n=1 Tax=Niallia hominis TaxID=3133173 RepID=A0ABV1EW21_9BACI